MLMYILLPKEDAPALEGLHSFKAAIQDDKILVTADPKRTLKSNKSRALAASFDGIVAPGNGTIIVGGGAGAIHTVESLREACGILGTTKIQKNANTYTNPPQEWIQGYHYYHKFRKICTY